MVNLTETWADIPGHPGYQASTYGRIRSIERDVVDVNGHVRHHQGRILRPSVAKRGHLRVNVGQAKTYGVHQLVALTYIGPCPPGLEVRHTPNPDPADNRPENLQYGTRVENMADMARDGNDPRTNRTHCPRNHPFDADNLVLAAQRAGKRGCLACQRAYATIKKHPEMTMQEAGDMHFRRIKGK